MKIVYLPIINDCIISWGSTFYIELIVRLVESRWAGLNPLDSVEQLSEVQFDPAQGWTRDTAAPVQTNQSSALQCTLLFQDIYLSCFKTNSFLLFSESYMI